MRHETWLSFGIGLLWCGCILSLNADAQDKPAPPAPRPQSLPDAAGRPTSPIAPVAPNAAPAMMTPLPAPTMKSGFGLPEGLATGPDVLLPNLGFGPAHCFPLTPTTCFEVGYKCYSQGLMKDALAFANHGLKLSNNARLYLLKAVCEMHLGRCDDAAATLAKYRTAALIGQETIGLQAAQERINDPMRVRLEYLLDVPN